LMNIPVYKEKFNIHVREIPGARGKAKRISRRDLDRMMDRCVDA